MRHSLRRSTYEIKLTLRIKYKIINHFDNVSISLFKTVIMVLMVLVIKQKVIKSRACELKSAEELSFADSHSWYASS